MRALFLSLTVTALACAPADPPPPLSVSLPFEARIGDAALRCGQTYPSVGTTQVGYTPRDFRFYLSNLRLVRTDGEEVPLALTQSAWQNEGVVLLDFEDASGECINGTPELNTAVAGEVPDGEYRGLRFTVGVPFELNHRDFSLAAAPLNSSAMSWGWEMGMKFTKLDGVVEVPGAAPRPHNFHLGSTGCETSAPNQVTGCAQPNRVEVDLPTFEPSASKVVANLASLFATTDLSVESGGATGCMSSPTDADCTSIFGALGLAHASAPGGGAQQLFSAE